MTSIGELVLIGAGLAGVLLYTKGDKFLGVVLVVGAAAFALYVMGVLGR